MYSNLLINDLLSESLTLPSSNIININNTIGNNNGSVTLVQPKIESQTNLFDQQPTKVVPIAPRFDTNQPIMTNSPSYTCSYCAKPIQERYFLQTKDRLSHGDYWHVQCLRCQYCDVVLADVATTYYTKDNVLLCKSDYIKRYGSRSCSLCSKVIGINEQVMRVSSNNIYHVSCFTCAKCQTPLVKGDRYVLCNGQPYCEKDNPLKSTTNTSTPKRGSTTSKRGAKAARMAAAATASVQQTYVTPLQYHPTGHMSLLSNPHPTSTITHSLLSSNDNNGSSSMLITNSDELF